MSVDAAQEHNAINSGMANASNGTTSVDHAAGALAQKQRKPYDYGGNPLAHINTGESARLQAFGGELQPGLYKSNPKRTIANPAPLGLSAFALTTFLLSLINLNSNGLTAPNIVVGAAFAYGGLVQLLAGMWEMAIGNTFGATALSSYGGFWIGTAIILTPGGFEIISNEGNQFLAAFGLYLMGWFIFTFLLLLLTLKSTVAFFFLFSTLDIAFLMLGLSYLYPQANAAGELGPHVALTRAGGAFGILAAFAAWYNAFAGMADPSNSFFLIPVLHFPWSDKGRAMRGKVDNTTAREQAKAEKNGEVV